MGNKSSEETKQEHLEVLGPEFGSVFNRLYKDVLWLTAKWQQYKEVFGTSPKRLDILDRSAGSFFRMVQGIIWDHVILGICLLTDPPSTGNKGNLSLARLTQYIEDEDFRNKLDAAIKKRRNLRNLREESETSRSLIETLIMLLAEVRD